MSKENSKLIAELSGAGGSKRKEIISKLCKTFNKDLKRCPIVLEDSYLLVHEMVREIEGSLSSSAIDGGDGYDLFQKCISVLCCLVIKSDIPCQKKSKFAKYFLDLIHFNRNHNRISDIIGLISRTAKLLGKQFILEGCIGSLFQMLKDDDREGQGDLFDEVMKFMREVVRSPSLKKDRLSNLSYEFNVLYGYMFDWDSVLSLNASDIVLEALTGRSDRVDVLATDELLHGIVRFFRKRSPTDTLRVDMMTIFGKLCTCSMNIHSRLANIGVLPVFRNLFGDYFHSQDHLIPLNKNKTVSLTRLLNSFIPSLPKNYKGFSTLYNIEPNLIRSEFCLGAQSKDQKDLVREMFPQVFHALRRNVDNPHSCHGLLLKMIHHNKTSTFSTCLPVDVVVFTRYLNDMITSESLKCVALGLAMLKILSNSFAREISYCFLTEAVPVFLRDLDGLSKTPEMTSLEKETVDWIRKTASQTLESIIAGLNISEECLTFTKIRDGMSAGAEECIQVLTELMEGSDGLHLELSSCAIPGLLLNYILSPDDDQLTRSEVMTQRYERLRCFVRIVLRLPEDTKSMTCNQLTGACRSRAFSNIVQLTKNCINVTELVNTDISDLFETSSSPRPASETDVDLGLGTCEALDRVLETPTNWKRLESDSTMCALMFINILHAVNSNWGVLFESSTNKCLLSDEHFINISLTSKYRSISNRCCDDDDDDDDIYSGDDDDDIGMFAGCSNFIRDGNSHLFHTLLNYPFLVSFDVRRNILHGLLQDNSRYDSDNGYMFHMERTNILREMSSIIDKASAGYPWEFQFENETGIGPGPTKEFYTVLSKDCQRADLGLWMGDQSRDQEYVFSSTGLFPSPRPLESCNENLVETIGKVLAKSLIDSRMMDLPLSKTLYKILLTRQRPTIRDVKDVLPSMSNFIDVLVDAIRHKSLDERTEFLSAMSMNFDDLFIDFTFPGYPEVELVEGGMDISLTPSNVELYLKGLMWRMFYEGTKKKTDLLISGFNSFVNQRLLNMFYPHEMESLFCGSECAAWSKEHLQENVDFIGGFRAESQPIKFLLEVLTSLTPKEQRKFIQFTTGYARLPVEGLKALSPRISVLPLNKDDPNLYYPVSMTCANRVFLPRYDSAEVLREKLIGAIKEPQTFEYL